MSDILSDQKLDPEHVAMKQSLWEDAAKDVTVKWQEQLRALTDLSCGPSALLDSVTKEQADCLAKQWKCYKPNGQKVYVRDILEKVAFWLEKIKGVGDVLVQYDPAHASLPWAGARFLLTAATSDINKYGTMLESIEVVVSAISRYTLIEQIYCWESTSEASQQLRKSVVRVYSAILVFLCKAKKYFSQNAAQRIVLSLVQLGKDSDDLTRDIATKDTSMEKVRSIVDGERAKNTLDRVDSLRGEMYRMRSDAQNMKKILLDLDVPMIQISLQLGCIQDGLDKEERRKIMRWLSTEQYTAHHKTIARPRLPGSGLWLFKKFEYQRWRKSSLCSLLWLHGDPGAGKSVLVSLVIDQISKELRNQASPPPLAYFYCTRESSEPKRANPTEIMLSILRQLSCKNDDTPILPPVTAKWQERLSEGSEHRLDLEECVDVILELTKERPAIIVIDALDECQRETRSELLEGLDRITQEAEHLVKVFVSSRRDSDIRNHFRKTPKLEIAARDNSQDIENYVSSELDKKIATGKLLNGQPSKELVQDVKAKLVERAEGIFRWVSASIQTLCDPSMQFEEDIRLALGQLPPTLEGVYAIIIAQIHKGAPLSMPLAKKALRWLLCAQQALRSDEFLKALSADLDISNVTITVENLLNICCNLVKYDSELDVVRFIHLSVREYLESREPEYEKSLSHSAVATTCLQTCFHGSKPKRKAHLRNAQNKTFYDYAIVYWPVHCTQSGAYRRQGKLGKLFNDFIYDKKYRGWLASWGESWEEMDLDSEGDSADGKLFEQLEDCGSWWPSPICQIFLASAFGFMEVLQDGRYLKKDWEKKNYVERDPFHIAVRHGQRDVVEYLATSSGQESADEGALIAAVSTSHKKMASYLLEQNPQLSITKSVIDVAVKNADVETVEFLFTKANRVEVTTDLINRAAGNQLSGKQIIDVLLNLDQDVSIVDRTIESACANRRNGFAIFESLLPRSGDSSITEKAVEIAASNDKCGLALLNALFQRASHLEVTTAMIEATCRNSTLEPLRFLLSRNETASISYGSLEVAVANKEVGDQMLVLLLEKCKTTLLDEPLLLSAMQNRKLGVELTKLLLAKAGGTTLTITMNVLEAAAENKHLGETLIEELLKDSKEWKLHPDVAAAAARNHYGPVAVLTLLLKADEHLEITLDTIIAAAKNPQYALELLDFILSHDPNIEITSAVIEAAAANAQSGFDVIQFLWRLGPFPVTPAAFKAAARNELCGDRILSIWLRTKLLDIPPAAVEGAMQNSSLGPEILRLLLQTGKVEISEKAIENASANRIYGPTLINTIIRHRSTIEVTDELLTVAAGNSATGSEVLEILLTHVESARVTPGVIEAAAVSGSSMEVITTLLNAAEPASITSEAVQFAFWGAREPITVLKCFLGKNPNVFLAPEVLEAIIERINETNTLIEAFKFLETCGKNVQMSEGMISQAAQSSTMPVLLALAEHCDRRREAMPVTQEAINISLGRRDSEAPAILEYLLKKLLDRGGTIQVEEDMVSIAVSTPWADKALKMLSELNGGAIPTSPKVIDLAVGNPRLSNSTIEKLLGIGPRQLRELRSTEAAIMAFIKNPGPATSLKEWFLALEQPVQVNENIMKAAAGESAEAVTTILDILRIQGQESLIPSLISSEVVVQSTTPETIYLLLRTMREYDQLVPITSGMMARCARWGIRTFRHLSEILRQQGQESGLSELVTEEVVLEAVKSNSAVRILALLKESGLPELVTEKVVLEVLKSENAMRILTLLKDTLGDERFCGLLSESHLVIAAGAMNDECINLLYPLVSSVQPKQYYEDISALNREAWNVRPVHLRKLLERKVFPNAKFPGGRSPLNAATYYGELVTAHLMLKYPEVDPNSTDADGCTPLSIAAFDGLTLLVKALLNRGVDRSIKDKDGKTAEDRAMEVGNYMIARLIRDFGTVVQPEEVVKEDESPTAKMERLSLRKSMTL